MSAADFLTHTANTTHTKNNTHTSGHGFDEYGYDGIPGNPMQAAGLFEARVAGLAGKRPVLLGQGSDLGSGRAWGVVDAKNRTADELPGLDEPAAMFRAAAKPRWGAMMLDIASRLEFESPRGLAVGPALLKVRTSGGAPGTLVSLTRPDRAFFEAQLPAVDERTPSRDKRYTEVLTQVAPPWAYYATIVGMQTERHQRTRELLGLALDLAYLVVMRFKMALACPRPSEYSAVIQPMIEVPQHASFPAGHATEGHVIAGVLGALVPGASQLGADLLRRAAFRIADNRIVAGLHFPIDNVAGRLVGDALGQYFLALCGAPSAPKAATFAQSAVTVAPYDARGTLDDLLYGGPGCTAGAALAVDPLPMLERLWAEAAKEWA